MRKGRPVRVAATKGTTADGTQAGRPIEGITAEHRIADRGGACSPLEAGASSPAGKPDRGDSNAIVDQAHAQGLVPVIPSRKHRKVRRSYDKDLYRLRHRVENAFLHPKRWRKIATRYAKNTASFLAAVHIRCLALWANIS